MRTTPLLAIILVAGCQPRRPISPAVPADTFSYKAELAELFDAIADLEHARGDAFDTAPARNELRDAFKFLCKGEQISCDPAAWQHPWTNRGESGAMLAHALGSLDRIYLVWSREKSRTFLAQPTQQVDEVRRSVRDLIFTREHTGVAHLPEHRHLLEAAEELHYARALVGDELPPTNITWDVETTRAVIEENIATIEATWPDSTATAHFAPDTADFTGLSYIDRMVLARDVVERAQADVDAERRSEHGVGPIHRLHEPLADVMSALGGTEGYRHAGPATEPAGTFRIELNALNFARKAVKISHGDLSHHKELQTVALQETRDAFTTALKATNVPDDIRWATRPSDGDWEDASFDLMVVDATFARLGDARFDDTRRHIAAAVTALDQMQTYLYHRDGDGQAFCILRQRLEIARGMLAVAPPSDTPWDVKHFLGDIDAATAALEAAHLALGYAQVKPSRWRHGGGSEVPYRVRLQLAHDQLVYATREAERDPHQGPHASLVHAHAVIDALAAALSGEAKTVTAQRSAPKRR